MMTSNIYSKIAGRSDSSSTSKLQNYKTLKGRYSSLSLGSEYLDTALFGYKNTSNDSVSRKVTEENKSTTCVNCTNYHALSQKYTKLKQEFYILKNKVQPSGKEWSDIRFRQEQSAAYLKLK